MTTTARETVPGRVRDALTLAGPAEPDVTVPRAYRTLPDPERLDLFVDRLVDYRARVHTCTVQDTSRVIADVLREHGARRIGVPAGHDPEWVAEYDGETFQDTADAGSRGTADP